MLWFYPNILDGRAFEVTVSSTNKDDFRNENIGKMLPFEYCCGDILYS